MEVTFYNLVKPIALLVYIIVLIFFLILSLILNYHWNKYSIHKRSVSQARGVYFSVSAGIILIMTVTLFMVVL